MMKVEEQIKEEENFEVISKRRVNSPEPVRVSRTIKVFRCLETGMLTNLIQLSRVIP